MDILIIIRFLFSTFVYSILNPFFIIVLIIIHSQYKKSHQFEEKILGKARRPLKHKMQDVILYGILCGLLGSFFIVGIGISIDKIGIVYIWPLALLLMLINPRYLCFSYAGGIIAMSSLLFGFPDIDVPGLIALVGVLHLIESLLIWIDGHRDSVPLIIEHEKYGLVGAFSLRKFWPIPFIILTIISMDVTGEMINMPDWWPLIRPIGIDSYINPIWIMIPVVAALGYSDIAITQTPKVKCRTSALRLGFYSIGIIAIAAVSIRLHWMQYVAAIAAPLWHEMLIIYSKNQQDKQMPLYIPPEKGLMVLDAFPGSCGEKMGLAPGDVIIALNGKEINREDTFKEILSNYPTFVWVDVLDSEGRKRSCECKCYPNGTNDLGLVIIPRDFKNHYKIKLKQSNKERFKNFFKRKPGF